MSNKILKKTAIAAAVGSALVSSAAIAADLGALTITVQGPTRSGQQFIPQLDAKMLINAATANAGTAAVKATLIYLDATNTQTGSTSVVDQDGNAGDGLRNFPITVESAAVKAVVVIEAGVGDTFDATSNRFKYIGPSGTVSSAYATQVAARDEAVAANALFAVDQTYAGIKLLEAKRDLAADATQVYLTFNADPYLKGTLGQLLDVNNQFSTSPVDPANDFAGLTDAAGDPLTSFVVAVNGPSVTLSATAAGSAFATLPNQVRTSATASPNLDDGTGDANGVKSSGLLAITTLEPPAYAATGETAILSNGDAAALYGDTGSANVTVRIRMDQEVTAWDSQADLVITAGGGVAAGIMASGFSVVADASDQVLNTILQVDLQGAGNEFYIDPTNGNVLYGASRDTAEVVAISLTGENTNTNTGAVALSFNGTTRIQQATTAVTVKAGVVEDPTVKTVDSDLNGYIDGLAVDFMQPLTGLLGGHNVGLVSYQSTTGLADATDQANIIVDRPVNLSAAGATINAANTRVSLLLNSADVPVDENTAAASTVHDYDASGTVDADDAALITDANTNTAVASLFNGNNGLPFQVEVGVTSAAAGKANNDHDTTLVYNFAYDSQTGEKLSVAAAELGVKADGASPVVKRVEYVEIDDGVASKRDPSGTVTIVASEALDNFAPNVGEFLFNGKPVSLINLDANMANKAVAINPNGNDRFEIRHVPGSVFDQLLALGIAPNVFDLNDNALVLSSTDAQNTVAAPKAAAPKMIGAVPVHKGDSLKWNQVVVSYDQNVEKAAADTDLAGLFVVRARVGARRGDAFEDRNAGSDDAYFDFRIKASDVAIATNQVTLTLPIDDFPADTTEIWVDYEGATADDIAAGSVDYLKSSETNTPANAVNDDLFFGDLGNNNGEIPESADLPSTVDIYEDEDTVKADLPPLFLATHAQDNHRNIFVQTIKGFAKRGGEALIDGTGIRVDLVRKEEGGEDVTYAEKAAIGDGFIEVRRGANSDGNTNTPTSTAGQSGEPQNPWNGTSADEFQTIALKNDLVKTTMLDDIAKIKANIAAQSLKISELASNNGSSAELKKIKEAIAKAVDDFNVKYGTVHSHSYGGLADADGSVDVDRLDPTLLGYIKVTTGDGKSSSAGNTDVNSNANVGRTATLVAKLDNKAVNGTTYYPVKIKLASGDIEFDTRGNQDNVSIRRGKLQLKLPVIASNTKSMGYYKVLDTAWTMVEKGQYKAVVGMEQQAVGAKTTKLQQQYNDAFILVSVQEPNADHQKWILTNSAEPSFSSYKAFGADIESELTNANRNIHNIELDNIARVQLYGDAAWETFGLPGAMARSNSNPLDLKRFFITIDEGTGRPVTVWDDNSGNEMMFTLGLNPAKANDVQLQFELGGGGNTDVKTIGKINPATGAAFAYLGDGAAKVQNSDVHNNDTSDGLVGESIDDGRALFVPLSALTTPLDLTKNGWHLVSLQTKGSLADFAAANANADGLIAFVNQAAGDNSSKNYTWFLGDTVNEDELTQVLPAGQAVFVHIKGAAE